MNAPPDVLSQEQVEFVSFVSGGQDYCIEVAKVREIRRWSPVTALPHAPDCFLGVMNLRGTVIPILDLALRLGHSRTAQTPRHVVLIVAAGERIVGLLVDSVAEILKVRKDTLRGVPPVPGAGSRLLQGMIAVDGAALRILDIGAVAPMLSELPA